MPPESLFSEPPLDNQLSFNPPTVIVMVISTIFRTLYHRKLIIFSWIFCLWQKILILKQIPTLKLPGHVQDIRQERYIGFVKQDLTFLENSNPRDKHLTDKTPSEPQGPSIPPLSELKNRSLWTQAHLAFWHIIN